jgi:hypothetical protein
MYYIKINGEIQPKPYQLISEAKAEVERLRAETTVNTWNILTEESAAYEMKIYPQSLAISKTEKWVIIILFALIAFGVSAMLLRRYALPQPTHYVAPELINYRDEQGNILGQLSKGTGIECVKIIGSRCQAVINDKEAYIYLNVLQKK